MTNKIKSSQYDIEIYNSYITMLYGEGDTLHALILEKFNVYVENYSGYGFCGRQNNNVFMCLKSPFESMKQLFSTIVHESVHVSWLIQQFSGCIFNDESQESQTYLVQHIFSKAYDFYKPFLKENTF